MHPQWRRGLPGLLAVLFGLLYWPLEALIHVLFFDQSGFAEELLHVSANEAWMRILISCSFVFFGVWVYRLLVRQQAYIQRLEMLKQALDHAGEGVIITNRHGVIEYVNHAFERITGYTVAEALGNNPRMLQSGRQDEEFYRQFWQSLRQHGRWQGRIWNRRKDGEIYPEQLHICAIRNASGEVLRYIGVFFDISEQLRLENQLQHAQKMEAIGTLVGGIAHDFNNILTTMTGNLFLVKMELEDLPLPHVSQLQEKLDLIENEGFRAAAMIQHLLAFARKGVVQMKPFDVVESMNNIIALARPSLGRHITLDVALGDEKRIIRGDQNQLEEVMINLLNNAAEALKYRDHPRIEVNLSVVHRVPEVDAEHQLTPPCLCLRVADNGKGIPEALLPRVFEPFFTTRDVGEGTGLGLAMVYGAVHMHHGVIDLQSEEGKGTTVSIYLPLGNEQPAKKKKTATNTPSHLLLLLEPDARHAELISQQLQGMGYDVLSTRYVEEAVSCLDDCHIATLLVNGAVLGDAQAADELRKKRQKLPWICIGEAPPPAYKDLPYLPYPVTVTALQQTLALRSDD